MKKFNFPAILLTLIGCSFQSNSKIVSPDVPALPNRKSMLTPEEISKLDSVNIKFQLRGNCYAYSSKANAIPSNGEAHSDNIPQKVDSAFPVKGIYMTINATEYVKIGSHSLGCKLYLVNTGDSLLKLRASDSRLYIIAEAMDEDNTWTSISYLPASDCGNSYHTVILDKNEFWEFNIPVFTGNFKTKLRYKLILGTESLYSNEIESLINKDQFDPKKKQGYSSKNIMDPYTN